MQWLSIQMFQTLDMIPNCHHLWRGKELYIESLTSFFQERTQLYGNSSNNFKVSSISKKEIVSVELIPERCF